MKTLELLLLGGAALLFLSKRSEAAGFSPGGASPQAIAQRAEELLVEGTDQQAGIAPYTPSKTPRTTTEALGQLAAELQTGADKQAIEWEAKLISQGTPKTPEVVRSEIQQGITNTATGGLNAIWTGVGYYNPFSGVTHIPTVYA